MPVSLLAAGTWYYNCHSFLTPHHPHHGDFLFDMPLNFRHVRRQGALDIPDVNGVGGTVTIELEFEALYWLGGGVSEILVPASESRRWPPSDTASLPPMLRVSTGDLVGAIVCVVY